ncbi:hypothetical protein [Bdellovibrio sp. KM01]|uniref:hypothetical protein n=1 Tax=Bdellovibrio sp. KM01 TaxID=2748865 RepID=UPI0015EA48CF|nr:hypothetical protein [Bdellovibrio sp. KM01]QLY24373.1 hypothetical protein HW988_12980 [Bdellovibrio sp. KM01]
MRRIKFGILFLCFALIGLIFPSRYLSPNQGVNTTGADYATHLNISEHLRDFNIFPIASDASAGKHAVSKYLPIYHGILGFHTLAWLLEKAGMPLPGAYALIMDLSCLSVLLVFIFILLDKFKKEHWPEILLATLVIFPFYVLFFISAVDSAFYSQLLSQALIAISVYLFTHRWIKCAVAVLLMSAFCYPDFMIWTIPVILFSPSEFRSRWRLLLVFPWIALMWVPFQRSSLIGPMITSPVLQISTYLFVIFFIRKIFSINKTVGIVSCSFAIYSLALTIFTMNLFTPSYYATKVSNFSYLLLPYLLLNLKVFPDLRGKILILATGYFLFTHEPFASKFNYATSFKESGFVNDDYLKIRIVKNELRDSPLANSCKSSHTFVIPKEAQNLKSNAFTDYQGLMENFDIYSQELYSSYLRALYGNSTLGSQIAFTRIIAGQKLSDWTQNLESAILQNDKMVPDFCLAIIKDEAPLFAKSQYFEKLYEGAQFVYFKPQKR